MEISLWSFPKEIVKGTYWISFGVCYELHVRSHEYVVSVNGTVDTHD